MSAEVPGILPGPALHRRVAGHGGVELAVVEVGSSRDPAWVLVHGAGSSARFVASAFAGPVLDAGARLVTYDLRGHGASDPARAAEDHRIDRQVADLLAVVTGTVGHVAVLGGVSLGAHTAVRAIAGGAAPLMNVEVVAACLPAWTGLATAGSGPHAENAKETLRVGIDATIERLRTVPGLPEWLRDTLLTDYPRHDPASLVATIESLDGGDAPDEDELRALGVPLAVVGWGDDPGHPLAVARQWARLAPRSSLGELRLDDLDDCAGGLEALGRCTVAAVEMIATAGSHGTGARRTGGRGGSGPPFGCPP